jgi:hypothetical protein
LREWQHIVGVKDTKGCKLYVDGEVVDEAPDTTEIIPDLRVLIGQLFPPGQKIKAERLFAGEIDEVAIYNRELQAKEIKQHIEMARPKRVPLESPEAKQEKEA